MSFILVINFKMPRIVGILKFKTWTNSTKGTMIWTSMRETLSLLQENNKGADQPAHVHSLISTLVIHSLESIMS